MNSPPRLFLIVRHGNTFATGEAPRRVGGRTDIPLTREGWAQARHLGRHFAQQQWHCQRVLTSPLLRTQQTAQAILQDHPDPPPVETCAWLREIDYGRDENQPEDAVIERIGHDALTAWEHRATLPDGWHIDAPSCIAAWRDLWRSTQAEITLIITSNGTARFALLSEPEHFAPLPRPLKLATGAYGLIIAAPCGTLRIAAWNQRP